MSNLGGSEVVTITSDDDTILNLPVIDYELSGFFTEDDLGELLPLIKNGTVTPKAIQDFLLEEWGDSGCVSPGYLCDNLSQAKANCTKVRMVPVLFGFGDIFAGTICEGGIMKNCPVGKYCPTPTENATICPEGFFCPHKTAEPVIECNACEEGEEGIKRDNYGYSIIYALAFIGLLYAIMRVVRRYRKDTYSRLAELAGRQMDAFNLSKIKAQQQERLEKVRPMLERMAQRLPPNASSAIVFKEDKTIQFNARQLFAALDKDGDGTLNIDELQVILQLRSEQLAHFIYRMNILEGGEATAQYRTISRACFVAHFLDVLQETCNFSPTAEDVVRLFDQMDTAKLGFIYAQDLYNSPISYFLTQPQINAMIKAFARVTKKQGGVPMEREESMFSFSQMPSLGRQRSTAHYNPSTGMVVIITRSIFTEHYPKILEQVSKSPVGLPTAGGIDAEAGPDAKTTFNGGTVDIVFEDLSLKVMAADNKQVAVVNEVSGRCRSGTMTALMGGSGAGKTSLLNALCGRAHYGETTGKIYINGKETRIEDHKALTGFVPQDDIVYAELTVKECFMYSGRFTSPKGTSLQELEDLADATLANLGLSRVANSIVGDVNRRGVSGGEKKRVNIGVELMARPSVLFLDEPTSGLDSTSALLVMSSMKNLCRQQNVTVISVIHQPRKVIFDLFDSLILLGWGGNMVYHGPVHEAETYFGSIPKPYFLPPGESLADWLIDVSTGLLEPVALDDGPGGGKAGPSSQSPEASDDLAKLRRADLFKFWKKHFRNLKNNRKALYAPPAPFQIPIPSERPPFWNQLKIQLERNLLVAWRNRSSKIVDICVIIVAITVSAGFEGPLELTRQHVPEVSFADYTAGTPYGIYSNMPQFFLYAVSSKATLVQFTMKLGVVTAVLLGLTATKAITGKRLEFFRESGSGYNVNAYFASVNIIGLFEHSFQMIIAGAAAFWLRNSIAYWYGYIYNFLVVMWLTVSWSLLIPLVVPPDNVTLVAGLFTAFFSLLFSGGLPPIEYTEIYHNGNAFFQILSGFLAVTRFFIEGMIVQEQRCLPAQSGYTLQPDLSVEFPLPLNSFSLTSLAGNDEGVVNKSCTGWYWSFWPALFVGITVRYIAAGVIHASQRGKQAKKSLMVEIRAKPWAENPIRRTVTYYGIGLIVLFIITCVLLMVPRGSIDFEMQDGLLTEQDRAIIDEILNNFIEQSSG